MSDSFSSHKQFLIDTLTARLQIISSFSPEELLRFEGRADILSEVPMGCEIPRWDPAGLFADLPHYFECEGCRDFHNGECPRQDEDITCLPYLSAAQRKD